MALPWLLSKPSPLPPLPALSPPTQSLPERRQDRPFPSSRGFLVLSCVLTATCKAILRHPNRRLRQLSITIQRYFFPRRPNTSSRFPWSLFAIHYFFYRSPFSFLIIPTILLLFFLRLFPLALSFTLCQCIEKKESPKIHTRQITRWFFLFCSTSLSVSFNTTRPFQDVQDLLWNFPLITSVFYPEFTK